MTCGIDKIMKNKKSYRDKVIHSINKLEIPPRREIWSGRNRSHPEEKFEYGAMDPTPKKYGWEMRRLQGKQGKKIGLDLRSTFKVRTSK